jgi:Tol biopolymer transport system component
LVARLRTALVGACVVGLLLAVPAHATSPGANGRIAFEGIGYPGHTAPEIYTMNADGSALSRVTNDNRVDAAPAWSPDGTKIAYLHEYGGNNPLWSINVVNPDGTGQTKLFTDAQVGNPTWSPDGKRIAVAAGLGCPDICYSNSIEIFNADGSGQPTRFGDFNGVDPSGLAWSPDGSKIAFDALQSNPDGSSTVAIWTINPDGTGMTRLTNGLVDDRAPSWSPNGSKITFTSNRDQAPPHCRADDCNHEIYVMNADGLSQTRVTFNPAPDDLPSWSPDGSKIAFTRGNCTTYTCSNGDIYTMNTDGTNPTNITQNPPGVFSWGPDWQPIPNRPPDCSDVTATPGTLWPPNHKPVPVSLSGATDPDGDQVTLTITGVTQDEPRSGSPDATLGPAASQVSLRAERDGAGDGRVYRIAFKATDGRGGECSGTATVGVPHNGRAPAVDSAPPSYDSLVR